MTAELVLIFLVALIVLGPSKLPMVAEHFAKSIRFFNQLKQEWLALWDAKMHKLTLEENERKAKKADVLYQKKDAGE